MAIIFGVATNANGELVVIVDPYADLRDDSMAYEYFDDEPDIEVIYPEFYEEVQAQTEYESLYIFPNNSQGTPFYQHLWRY